MFVKILPIFHFIIENASSVSTVSHMLKLLFQAIGKLIRVIFTYNRTRKKYFSFLYVQGF